MPSTLAASSCCLFPFAFFFPLRCLGWGGPLTSTFVNAQHQLQLQILNATRGFGMLVRPAVALSTMCAPHPLLWTHGTVHVPRDAVGVWSRVPPPGGRIHGGGSSVADTFTASRVFLVPCEAVAPVNVPLRRYGCAVQGVLPGFSGHVPAALKRVCVTGSAQGASQFGTDHVLHVTAAQCRVVSVMGSGRVANHEPRDSIDGFPLCCPLGVRGSQVP
jgi:hypothetical protein